MHAHIFFVYLIYILCKYSFNDFNWFWILIVYICTLNILLKNINKYYNIEELNKWGIY